LCGLLHNATLSSSNVCTVDTARARSGSSGVDLPRGTLIARRPDQPSSGPSQDRDHEERIRSNSAVRLTAAACASDPGGGTAGHGASAKTGALKGQANGLPSQLPGPVAVAITSGGNDMKASMLQIELRRLFYFVITGDTLP
jgi:hypothetical protein